MIGVSRLRSGSEGIAAQPASLVGRVLRPASVWLSIVLLFVLLDLSIVFGTWLWQAPPGFYGHIDPRWAQAHEICSQLHQPRAKGRPRIVIVGSSLANLDVDESIVSRELADIGGIGVDVVKLAMYGAPASDVERITRYIAQERSRLLIYMTAARDYPRKSHFNARTTPLGRVLYPPDEWLPSWRGTDSESFLSDLLSTYWLAYRYRTFVRLRLGFEARRLTQRLGLGHMAAVRAGRNAPTPEEVDHQVPFEQFRNGQPVNLELYLRYLGIVKGARVGGYLTSQETINAANYGIEGNEQVSSLKSLLRVAVDRGIHPVLIYPPINPIVGDNESRYYDRKLADQYAALFDTLARNVGGTAADWRALRAVDEFADFNHLNGRGRQALSLQVAALVRPLLDGAASAASAPRRQNRDGGF